MLRDRGIRKGIKVFIKDAVNPDLPIRKARVVNMMTEILFKLKKVKLLQCLK